MGLQKKLTRARKTAYALRTGYYPSGSPAGFGVQNARMRLGITKPDASKLAYFRRLFK